jgi:DNA (cytosine-5)-methyltransferase 1
VYDDFESEGYEVQSFLIPAASVGAPHQRYRVWFIAYANDKGRSSRLGKIQTENGEISKRNNDAEFSNTSIWNAANTISIRGREDVEIANRKSDVINKISETGNVANTSSSRFKTNDSLRESEEQKYFTRFNSQNISSSNFTNSESIGQEYSLENGELERGRFGQSNERNFWDSFPSKSPLCGGDDGIPRQLDSITFPKWRNESIKAYGNAIVPQVAHQFFKTIEEFEKLV